jgi:hypothetical protein
MWQAERAQDPAVARAMRDIARDEARHAALAWRVLRWGAPLLDEPAVRRTRRRIRHALRLLRAGAERVVDPMVVHAAGHPPRDAARALAAELSKFVLAEADGALGRARVAATRRARTTRNVH